MKKQSNLYIYIGILSIVLAIAAGAGWIMNIVEIVGIENWSELGGMEILRIIGVPLTPLGAVLGWF